MGIHKMRARAAEIGGSIEVDPADGSGTRVTLSVPFETPDARWHRRGQALGLAGLLGVVTVFFLLDLFKKGPGRATSP